MRILTVLLFLSFDNSKTLFSTFTHFILSLANVVVFEITNGCSSHCTVGWQLVYFLRVVLSILLSALSLSVAFMQFIVSVQYCTVVCVSVQALILFVRFLYFCLLLFN